MILSSMSKWPHPKSDTEGSVLQVQVSYYYNIIVQEEIDSFVATKTETPLNQFHPKSKGHQTSTILKAPLLSHK